MRIAAALVFCSLAGACLANDTTAVLTTGGLEFVTNEHVVMESEDLFISKQEIRVAYTFRNDSAEDQDVLVAFPMPDLVNVQHSNVGYPGGPSDNLFSFQTTVNGEPVEAELHEYAFALGVERTDTLRQLGIPLVPFSDAASEAINALDPAIRERLVDFGLVVPDEFDAWEGEEKPYWPAWTYKATYTWEAHFPAGETVTVEHRYKPSIGGTTSVAILYEPSEGFDPASEYVEKYCTDDAFIEAVRKTLANPDELWSAPFYETWISYILTTGSNWSGGSIENFRLVVDKGSPENLVSFCGEDVRKIGPTTFEMVKQNFWPERELEILILERLDNL